MTAVGASAWQYYFTRVSPNGGDKLGAYHGMEIPYAFGVVDPLLPRTDVDARLSETMLGYWTRFATTGNPNGASLPEWPAYRKDTDLHLELGEQIQARGALRSDACAIGDMASRLQWGPPAK
jgi:para-nitrobenzyl esterase